MSLMSNRYFDWLQRNAPSETVERYPLIDSNGETSLKGVYIIGDLTGIPLLKLAAESGKNIIDHLRISGCLYQSREERKRIMMFMILSSLGQAPQEWRRGLRLQKINFGS